MKLIIDISEDTYTECQGHIYFPDTGAELFNAVQNGIPLDDVKAEIKEKCDSWEKDGYLDEADALNVALKIIDKHIGKAEREE